MDGYYVDLYVEIPELIHQQIQEFLEQNPRLSQNDFFLLAASRYLAEKRIEQSAIEQLIKQTLAA